MKELQSFKINAMPNTFTADEPTVREARNGDDRNAWRSIMDNEVRKLQRMGCWKEVDRAKDEQVMHTNFVLKRKRDENGMMCITRLVS